MIRSQVSLIEQSKLNKTKFLLGHFNAEAWSLFFVIFTLKHFTQIQLFDSLRHILLFRFKLTVSTVLLPL